MPNGTGIPRFCGVCGLTCLGKLPPAPKRPPTKEPDPCEEAGNPVHLSNGQQMPSTGGLRCGGLTPIATGMSYNPVDAFNNVAGTVGSLGFGWVMDYDVAFLPFSGPQKRLILPSNDRVNFVDDGTGNYKPFDDPRFDGSVIRATNLAANEWELKFADGRLWRFQPFAGIPGVIRGGPPTFVTEMVDPQGNVLTINRQSNGRIASVGSAARNVTMTYGTNGFVSEIRDSASRIMRYTYNADNRVQSVTDPDSRITSYTYVGDEEIPVPAVCGTLPSGGKRLKTIQYPDRPAPTENFYGSDRRVLRQVSYDGTEHRFAYKVAGSCVTHTSTPNVRCSGAGCPDVDSWDNFQAGWRFFGGNVVSTAVTLPNNQTRKAEFNSSGIATTHTNAQGQPTSREIDAANRITASTDALGRKWNYTYDTKGNLTQQVDPLGRITQYTFDATWNKPTTITRYDDANQAQTWSFTYDPAKGTPLTVTNPLNQTTTFAYTPRGEVASVTSPLSQITRFEYNAAGDLTRQTDPLGNVTRFAYDNVGRRTAVVDPLDFVTGTQYNGSDQVTTVTDARNKSTQMAYDAAARLSAVTNARGNVIESYGYDAGDRVTARTDAKLKTTSYVYDTAGRMTSSTDRKGVITTYSYDELDRVITLTRPEGLTRFTYDAVGRLSEITDPSGSISYRYDLADRLVKETQLAGGISTEIAYTYDALDRRTSRVVNGLANETTTYGYDPANRLTSITYRGQTTTYTYDAAGRLTNKTLPNGIKQALTFDNANRLTELRYTHPDNSLIEALTYGYDSAGRRTSQTSSQAALHDTAFTATYDEADRMSSITLTASNQTYDLTYDDNGNLARKANRNATTDVTTYTWDSRNRLSRIDAPAITATFEYDVLGRRVARTVNGITTRYFYDGLQAIGELRGGQQDTLLTGLGIDEAIARYTAAGLRTYLSDALGSVIAQTRADRSVVNRYRYSGYGETTATAADEGNSVQYTARENDATGLFFYRARYYDPVLKRFVSEDPIGLAGGINAHAYVNGDPITYTDPLGLQASWASWGRFLKKGAPYYPKGTPPQGPPKMHQDKGKRENFENHMPDPPVAGSDTVDPLIPDWRNDPKLDLQEPNCVIRFVCVCKKNSPRVCPTPAPRQAPNACYRDDPVSFSERAMHAPEVRCFCAEQELVSMCR
ncbi:MAG: RHS repeat-associated core domain-containing protein [Burkholderiales bacterium]